MSAVVYRTLDECVLNLCKLVCVNSLQVVFIRPKEKLGQLDLGNVDPFVARSQANPSRSMVRICFTLV